MVSRQYRLVADVNSANPAAIEPLLRQLVGGEIAPTVDGSHVVTMLPGARAQDLNRSLLSALRRVERRTRLRAAWTVGGVTERFFDPLLWRQHRGADRDLNEFRTLTWGRR